jgi:hypothetical protein
MIRGLLRLIGVARANVKIGMMNPVYNLSRWEFLARRLVVKMTSSGRLNPLPSSRRWVPRQSE